MLWIISLTLFSLFVLYVFGFIPNLWLITCGPLFACLALCTQIFAKKRPWNSSISFPYPDIGVKVIRIPNSCAAKVFYPCEPNGKFAQYMRPHISTCLVQWMFGDSRLARMMFYFLSTQQFPCWDDAPLKERDEKYPVVFFSHGLGGSYELYSQLCSSWAKFGFVVFAFEHECGAGIYSKTVDGVERLYKFPPGDGVICTGERSNNQAFRRQQIQHRDRECQALFGAFEGINQDLFNGQLDVNQSIFSGHSFGGASTIANIMMDNSPCKGLVVLCMWGYCLGDDVCERGNDLPILFIEGDEDSRILHDVKANAEIIRNCPRLKTRILKDTTHTQFSDAPFWFPPWIARLGNTLGKNSDRNVTFEKNLLACVYYARDCLGLGGGEFDEFVESNPEFFYQRPEEKRTFSPRISRLPSMKSIRESVFAGLDSPRKLGKILE